VTRLDGSQHARNGRLGGVFDTRESAVADLRRLSSAVYRTVLSVLGVEPSHADAELVDGMTGPSVRRTTSTRHAGLHVGSERRPEAVDAFWQAGIDAGYRDDGAPVRAPSRPGLLRRLPARPGRQQRGGGAHGARGPVPDGRRRPPLDPRSATSPRSSASTPRSPRTRAVDRRWTSRTASAGRRELQLLADRRRAGRSQHPPPRSRHRTTRPCGRSTPPRLRGYEDHGEPGERAVYHPGITARSSSTPTGTTSRSSTTNR